MKSVKRLITALALCAMLPVSAQTSFTTAWNEFVSGADSNVLLDFSYAGYDHGLTLPGDEYPGYTVYDVTQYGAVANDGISDRPALEKIINLLGKKPSVKAIIYFPEGEFILHSEADDVIDSNTGYKISTSINLIMGNVILKGAGRDKTILSMTAPMLPRDPKVLYSSPVLMSMRNNGTSSPAVYADVTGAAAKNTFSVKVSSTSLLSVGQWVCLYMAPNNADAVIKEELLGRNPSSTMTDLINNGVTVKDYHQIKSISGDIVTFEEPIMHAVNPAYGWKLIEYRHYEGVGVEDLTFKGQSTDHFKHHGTWNDDGGYKPIDFVRLTNSWMRRVNFESVSECATFQDCANVSCYNVEIKGNRGHSAVRMAASSRGFIANVYDHSDGYATSDKQFTIWKTGLGQYHACGVSKPSMGNVIWNCRWGDDACFESHATQPRATLIDCCTGGFMQLRMGGDLSQLPNHLDDLTMWNFECTVTNPAEFPFEWWSSNSSKWYLTLPPTLVGFHGTNVVFAANQIKRNEAQGQTVNPRSLYMAQLERRLGYMPQWIQELSGDIPAVQGKTWDFAIASPADEQLLQNDANWTSKNDGGRNYYVNQQSIGSTSGTTQVDPPDIRNYCAPLTAGDTELAFTKGLLFGLYYNGKCKQIGTEKMMICTDDGYRALRLNINGLAIVIPDCKKGQQVIIHSKSTTSTIARYINVLANLNIQKGFAAPDDPSVVQESSGTVLKDGDVVLSAVNGNFLYDITLKDANGNTIPAGISTIVTKSRSCSNDAIYNLSGQRVTGAYKGIVIRNGRKYFQH